MSKAVQLNINIDENGVVHVEPQGTQNTECLELMAFLDKLKGFSTLETVKNADYKTKKVQINSTQQVNR